MASFCLQINLWALTFFISISFSHNLNPSSINLLLNNATVTTETPLLEPIVGTINHRLRSKSQEDKQPWFSGREMAYSYCVRSAKCEPLRFSTCFGAKVPYSMTSLDLTDSYSQEQTQERLHAYKALKHVPKCWAVIQPFLCAVHMPKCEMVRLEELVFLPSIEMCRITLDPCKILYNTSFFPDFLKCNESLFPSICKNDAREMKFNTTGQCLEPLVETDSIEHFYEGIDNCGMQCTDPLYSGDEHRQIHKLIAWGATVCLACNLFTVVTFLIDWQTANKYPALVIFYISCCFLVACIGWLVQFSPGAREDIVCRKDRTLRQSEPSAGENLSCVVVFVLVYYSLIAAMVWFVIFTYVWHMSFKAIGKIQERIDKKGAYFHLIAWSLPLVLTITTMALSEIDGNSVVGICFVGYLNHPIRAGLLLGPICGVLLVGGYFLTRGLLTLIRLKITSKEVISARANSKIKETILRMGMCTILVLVFIVATFICHIHEFKSSEDWASSLKNYIICRIVTSYAAPLEQCRLQTRPSVGILQLHLLSLFAAGIVMSSWVWTGSTADAWARYVRRKFGCELEEPVKLQKHKLIAQAFARRKEFYNEGRLSISFHNTHTDPVGLNFDLNSVASHDFSSTWANNLPRFVNRRCALTGPATGSVSSSQEPRRSSMDSQISFSVRHVSVESRRNSMDSQVSVKIAEMKTKVASRTRSKGKRNRRRDFINKRSMKSMFSKRESTTSVESQISAHIISALSTMGNQDVGSAVPNLNRRKANGTLDTDHINDLITNGKLILPFLQTHGLTTSDDENNSVASFRIRDSRLDVVLRQKTHLSDSAESLNNQNSAVNIEEYESSDDNKETLRKSKDIFHEGLKSTKGSQSSTFCMKNRDGRGSKDSFKSNRSRKSSRQSSKKSRRNSRKGVRNSKLVSSDNRSRNKSNNEQIFDLDQIKKNNKQNSDLDSSLTSFCSELSPLAIQSSFSGVSVGKTHSRNSKTSCDVGIQANAHEIATQTLSSFEMDLKKMAENDSKCSLDKHSEPKPKPKRVFQSQPDNELILSKAKNRYDSTACQEEDLETQQLLLKPSKKEPMIIPKKRKDSLTINCQNETERLKLLLLPSK